MTEDVKEKIKRMANIIDEETKEKMSNMVKELMTEKPQRKHFYEEDYNQTIKVFLDTNALSGIINGTNTLGDDIRKMTKFTHRYIFCFSSYTLYEIYKGDKKRWEKLLAFLSEIYFLVFLPRRNIIQYEYNKYVGKKTSPREICFYLNLDIKNSKSIKKFKKMICDFYEGEIKNVELESTAVQILKENYNKLKINEKQIVEAVLASCGFTLAKKEDYIYFPSIRVFALSVIGRVSNSNRKNIGNNDVVDSWISYCMPYVHQVITEKEQRGLLEQAKPKIKEIEHLIINKISEFDKKEIK